MKAQKMISMMAVLALAFVALQGEAASSTVSPEAGAMNKLKAIKTSTYAMAQQLLKVQIATLTRIEKLLPSVLSKNDEALCLTLQENLDEVTPASEACDRMADVVQALADQEFEAAGLGAVDNVYQMAFDKALEDVYQAKFALEEAGSQASQAYLDYESALIYLICKASVQERGGSAYVAGSMLVYSTASQLNSKKKLSIEMLVLEAHKQVESEKGLAEYVLGKN